MDYNRLSKNFSFIVHQFWNIDSGSMLPLWIPKGSNKYLAIMWNYFYLLVFTQQSQNEQLPKC